jgi:hypothetical protein
MTHTAEKLLHKAQMELVPNKSVISQMDAIFDLMKAAYNMALVDASGAATVTMELFNHQKIWSVDADSILKLKL